MKAIALAFGMLSCASLAARVKPAGQDVKVVNKVIASDEEKAEPAVSQENVVTEAAVVAHASELLRKHTKHSVTEEGVRGVLAQKRELQEAVSAHLAHLKTKDLSKKDDFAVLERLRRKLRQRAQNDLKDAGLQLDKTTGGKTQCRCFIEQFDNKGTEMKLVDLDDAKYDYGDLWECSHKCFQQCGSKFKFKFDEHEAKQLGAEIGGVSRKVAQCEGGECECLDATESYVRMLKLNAALTWLNNGNHVQLDVVRPPSSGDLNSEPNEYHDADNCLRACDDNCKDFERGDTELDLEGMCIDEWTYQDSERAAQN